MKKIMIITGNDDLSATNVIKWVNYLDKSVVVIRLNTEELFETYNISQKEIDAPIFFSNNNIEFSTDEISVVWSWKWYKKDKELKKNKYSELSNSSINQINNNINAEKTTFLQYFLYNLNNFGCNLAKPLFNNRNK